MVLLPPFFLDCVVAIGYENAKGEYDNAGTGFFYGAFQFKDNEDRDQYQIFLVTNRHVLEQYRTNNLERMILRCNPKNFEEQAQSYALQVPDITDPPLWTSHPNPEIDISIIPILYPLLMEHGMQVNFFRDNLQVANIEKCKELGILEGDFIYVLGFPMDLVGKHRNSVIARSGIIARIKDTLERGSNDYLIDSFVFPGNSGGPVVNKPEMMSIKGTSSQSKSLLIGIVQSYVPYQDVAISRQTKRPRVIFEENSGLASVIPVDYIQEVIEHYYEIYGKMERTSS